MRRPRVKRSARRKRRKRRQRRQRRERRAQNALRARLYEAQQQVLLAQQRRAKFLRMTKEEQDKVREEKVLRLEEYQKAREMDERAWLREHQSSLKAWTPRGDIINNSEY